MIFHLLQRALGVLRDALSVAIQGDGFLRRTVVHPHQVATGPLRHRADERAVSVPFLSEHRGEMLAEQSVVVRRRRRRAEVVLRIIGQHRDRRSVGGLQRDDRQPWIDRPGRADDVRAEIAGMHVGQHGRFAEGVDDFLFWLANPTAVVRVFPVVDRCPANPRGLEVFGRRHDPLGDLAGQPGGIVLVLPGSQATHRRRSGMGVCRRHHHVVGRDAAVRVRLLFGLINE